MNRGSEKIAIFASGNGTNAENIIHFFMKKKSSVVLAVTDNPDAGVIKRAERQGVKCIVCRRDEITHGTDFAKRLQDAGISLIILAGYLGKIGKTLLSAYPRRILNIHPALLPKYGGKGMYGHRVHEAVLREKEDMSGITIHIIDEHYDRGEILCQAYCPVLSNDTVERLADRIHRLEYIYYPIVIEEYIDRLSISNDLEF